MVMWKLGQEITETTGSNRDSIGWGGKRELTHGHKEVEESQLCRASSQLEEEAIKRQVAEFPVYEKQQPIDKVVDLSFCLTQFCNHSIPEKHTEAYISYKLFGLLAQACY